MRTSSVSQPWAQHPTPTFPEVQVASWGTKRDAVGSLSQQALRLLQRLPGPHLRVDTLGTNTGATFQTCQALKSSLRTMQGVLLPCQREHLVSLFHRVTTKRWGLLWKLIISQFPKAELPPSQNKPQHRPVGRSCISLSWRPCSPPTQRPEH